MAKIYGNAFLLGAAFSFMAFLIALQAFLTTAWFDVVFAVKSTLVLAAVIPAVAYCVGLMLARGGKVTRSFLFGILQLFLLFLRCCSTATGTGFWAALSCSTLAAGIVFLAKVADGTDERFHIVKSVIVSYWPSSSVTVGSDFASDICVLLVFVLANMLHPFDPTVPRPGSFHAFVAGLYSPPPAQQAAPPHHADLPQL